jgi:hypothetical protein
MLKWLEQKNILGFSGVVLDGSLSGGVLFLVYLCTLVGKPLFICLFSRVADGDCRYSLDCFFQFLHCSSKLSG